jgi:hypothetical protein
MGFLLSNLMSKKSHIKKNLISHLELSYKKGASHRALGSQLGQNYILEVHSTVLLHLGRMLLREQCYAPKTPFYCSLLPIERSDAAFRSNVKVL